MCHFHCHSGTSEKNLIWSPICWIALRKTIRRIFTELGLGMYVRSLKTRLISVSMCGLDYNDWTEAKCGHHVDEVDEICAYPTSFLDHVYVGCTQRECKPNKTMIEQYTKIFESRISVGSKISNKTSNVTFGHGKDMLKNALSNILNWQPRKWINCTKFKTLTWMITFSKKRNSNLLTSYQMFDRKLS